MKFEGGSLKCERDQGCGFSNFALHPSNFCLAATIKRNFEELGI
jgi:hypothetical protein